MTSLIILMNLNMEIKKHYGIFQDKIINSLKSFSEDKVIKFKDDETGPEIIETYLKWINKKFVYNRKTSLRNVYETCNKVVTNEIDAKKMNISAEDKEVLATTFSVFVFDILGLKPEEEGNNKTLFDFFEQRIDVSSRDTKLHQQSEDDERNYNNHTQFFR